MTSTSEIKSYEDYKSFIMICAAGSDFNVSDEEHEFIVQSIPESRYQVLKRMADRCSDYECVNIIAEHKSLYINSPDQKKELMKENGYMLKTIVRPYLQYIKKVK